VAEKKMTSTFSHIPVRRGVAIALTVWTILLAGSLAWNLWIEQQTMLRLASIEASASFNKDLVYRRWAAKEGGIYVPASAYTPPNPYLSHVPERDITSPSGRKLTLVNPAYMTRQVYELSAEQYGVRGHITSLKPLRPENRPDSWETKVLNDFETGVKKVSTVASMDSKPYLRFMRPFIVEQPCLKCHAAQGYKLGDIRGGISVSVPLDSYYSMRRTQFLALGGWHLLIYLTGCACFLLGAVHLQAKAVENEKSQLLLGVKQAELALFRELIDQSNDAVFIINPVSGRIMDANERASLTLGYTPEQLLALTVMDLDPLISDTTGWQAHVGIMREKKEMILTSQHRRQDGSLLPVEINIRYLVREQQDYLVATARDITERQQAEEELHRYQTQLESMVAERTGQLENKTRDLERSQQALLYLIEDVNETQHELEAANLKLQELDRLKSMFIASMSHELRTPLNSIIGFSSILADEWLGPLNPEQKMNQATILRNGKHLLALINDVIDISKVEAGMIESISEEFDLDEVIAEATANMKDEVSGKGLALTVAPCRVRLHTDRRRLLQCLINLISNAVKFTDQGTITVDSEQLSDDGRIAIMVRDTGIGISADDQGRLFAPFMRLNPSNGKYPGTGLGLYLSRKLATEVLGGDLTVASAPGEGSTFTITIPLRRES
jgi:PAS domain S-box-containing protein